jgi:transposase-like protein
MAKQEVGAAKGERSAARLGYRSGYYERSLVTRVARLELCLPQNRDGRFSTALFERYQRSEKALVSALAEMSVQGVSTRKVKTITAALCGHAFSASVISNIVKRPGCTIPISSIPPARPSSSTHSATSAPA